MTTPDQPRRCRHCHTTARSCRAKYRAQELPCCPDCNHEWKDDQ